MNSLSCNEPKVKADRTPKHHAYGGSVDKVTRARWR
jgi:hypothetical protein